MSITFYCAEAPRVTRPCWCKEDGEDCDDRCPGYRMVSEAPECNFANTNAWDLLCLLQLESHCHGEIQVSELGDLQQRIIRALNVKKDREPLDRPRTSGGGPGTGKCRWVECGNTDEQTIRRLKALQQLVAYAKDHQYIIFWG